MRGTSFSGAGKRTRQRKSKREGSVSRDCFLVKRGKTLPAERSLDWSWEDCLVLCPLDTVPRLTALPCSPACLPGWSRIQPSASSPLLSFTPRCPISLQPHPLQDLACFRLLYHLSPGAVDLRMRKKEKGRKKENN